MSRFTGWVMITLAAATVWAQTGTSQPEYVPAVPSASSFNSYGGYLGGSGGGTVEGSMMHGMASVISAQGDYNLATSAAAVNLTQARKQDIQNRQSATAAYFEIREINRAATAAKRDPRLSQEQLVRIAAQAAPKPISSKDFDPVSGNVTWPELLRDEQFAKERAAVEPLLAKQAQYGRLGISDHNLAGQAIESMSSKLSAIIKSVPSGEYIAAKNFLKSLMYRLNKAQLG